MLNLNFRVCLILFASLFAFAPLGAEAKEMINPTQVESDEEAFLIRRIAEFWKDGDFGIVKTQIADFLEQYPNSDLKDYFAGILGDIYLQENQFEPALLTYQSINDSSVQEKILLNKLQCYYELDKYAELASDGRPYLSSESEDIQDRKDELYFLMGEALFRGALQEENFDTKAEMAREAQGFYGGLPEGRYGEICEFALAEILALTGENEKAAHAYKELSEKHPSMEEDLLFQVATLETKFNQLGAAETFRKVTEYDGERAHEAAFNLMVLLFQNEEYEEVIENYEKITPIVAQEYVPTLNFIVGKSFFSSGSYQNAIGPLEDYITSTNAPSDQLKNALLIQMTCAHQTSNEELFTESFEKLEKLFPEDPEIPKALFMHAMILKEQGAISRADEKLKVIKENYGGFEDQETFLFEYGLLAHQNERWEESRNAFKSYVEKYDEGSRLDAAWKLYLSSSISLYKHSNEESIYDKTTFFFDLEAILSHSHFLTENEMTDYALLYAKTAYELDYFPRAIAALQDHIFATPYEKEEEALAEAHFIAGLCHAEVQSDYSAFCIHLEEAMTLNPDHYDSPSSHLQLYNAYISLAGFGDASVLPPSPLKQNEFIDQAADHLQEAISKGETDIKEENRLWLAGHYYQKVSDHTESQIAFESDSYPEIANAVDRAIEHYQALLVSNGRLISLGIENLHLENEVVKLTKLLEYQGAHQQKLELVKELLEEQSEKPELNWSSQNDALYQLATAYNALGEKEKAYETFSFIHGCANYFPSAIANHATLEAARLHFELLEDGLRTETNQEVLAILNDLKELQIRKNPASEPTHLEAALEYAKIRSELSNPGEEDARYLFFLSRVKDDFNSEEDIVTQDYLASLNHDGNKRRIFDAYMKFIDAERLRIEAKNFYNLEKLREMEELHESALTLYSEIKNDPNTPRGLYNRISTSVHEINALNAY